MFFRVIFGLDINDHVLDSKGNGVNIPQPGIGWKRKKNREKMKEEDFSFFSPIFFFFFFRFIWTLWVFCSFLFFLFAGFSALSLFSLWSFFWVEREEEKDKKSWKFSTKVKTEREILTGVWNRYPLAGNGCGREKEACYLGKNPDRRKQKRKEKKSPLVFVGNASFFSKKREK